MGAATPVIDTQVLGKFTPLNTLTPDQLKTVGEHAEILDVGTGEALFAESSTSTKTLYLLLGEVEISLYNQPIELIRANSNRSRAPIEDNSNRGYTARAKTNATLVAIETDVLTSLASYHQDLNNFEQTETGQNTEWLKRFLRASVFLKLPPKNLQSFIDQLEEIPFVTEQPIIERGPETNYYYIIKRGRCRITHNLDKHSEPQQATNLGPGEGFGEDAEALSGGVSVTALEDGSLMRLDRKHFKALLVGPLSQPVSYQGALTLLKSGARFLDIRPAPKNKQNGLKNSKHIPFPRLRARLSELDASRDYIVYCDDGDISPAAAFLLNQQGFKAHTLSGGVRKVIVEQQKQAKRVATRAQQREPVSVTERKSVKPPSHEYSNVAASHPSNTVTQGSAGQQRKREHANAAILATDDVVTADDLTAEIARIEADLKSLGDLTDFAGNLVTDAETEGLGSEPAPFSSTPDTPNRSRGKNQEETLATLTPSQNVDHDEADSVSNMQPQITSKAKKNDNEELGWISDSYLWESVAGYHPDPAVDKLLEDTASGMPSPANQRPTQLPADKPNQERSRHISGSGKKSRHGKNHAPAQQQSVNKRLAAPASRRRKKSKGKLLFLIAVTVLFAGALLPIYSPTAAQQLQKWIPQVNVVAWRQQLSSSTEWIKGLFSSEAISTAEMPEKRQRPANAATDLQVSKEARQAAEQRVRQQAAAEFKRRVNDATPVRVDTARAEEDITPHEIPEVATPSAQPASEETEMATAPSGEKTETATVTSGPNDKALTEETTPSDEPPDLPSEQPVPNITTVPLEQWNTSQ